MGQTAYLANHAGVRKICRPVVPYAGAGVTLNIPARFLNQEQGAYFDWEFQKGIREGSTLLTERLF